METIQKVNVLFWERRMVYENMNPNDVEPNTFASIVHNTELGRCLECTVVFFGEDIKSSLASMGERREVDSDAVQHSLRESRFQRSALKRGALELFNWCILKGSAWWTSKMSLPSPFCHHS